MGWNGVACPARGLLVGTNKVGSGCACSTELKSDIK